jgi:hypothetical protein
MKSAKKISMALMGMVVFLLCIGVVTADPSVKQTPEIQGFATTTTMDVVGLATESDAVAWQISNQNLSTTLALPGHLLPDGPYIVDWPNFVAGKPDTPGQVLYTTAYSEETSAVNGDTTYIKSMSVNTGNKVISQSNLKAEKTVTFDGTGAGQLISAENLMLDGAGQLDFTTSRMLCPFAAADSTFIPAFCNIVQTGSSVDVTTGKLVTSTSEGFVAATADVPVTVAHSISLTGTGNAPASGSAVAYIKMHDQEGRTKLAFVIPALGAKVYTQDKTEDLTYSETTSASGLIPLFTKTMNYQSGKLLV